ncbi:MAG: hypothetical protein HF973_03640 [Chloroflexi bacterium]|nr:hypothetical protein [Chloroflexota bacterium]
MANRPTNGTIGGMIHLRAIRLNPIPAEQAEQFPFNIPAVRRFRTLTRSFLNNPDQILRHL